MEFITPLILISLLGVALLLVIKLSKACDAIIAIKESLDDIRARDVRKID